MLEDKMKAKNLLLKINEALSIKDEALPEKKSVRTTPCEQAKVLEQQYL
jgi:hypothetical protein